MPDIKITCPHCKESFTLSQRQKDLICKYCSKPIPEESSPTVPTPSAPTQLLPGPQPGPPGPQGATGPSIGQETTTPSKVSEPSQDITPAVGLTSPAMPLQSSGQKIGQATAAATTPAQHVADAVKKHDSGYNLAHLHKVRAYLESVGIKERSAQDAAIHAARKAGLVSASNIEGRHGVSKEELDAAIKEHGGNLGFLSIREQHFSDGGTVEPSQDIAPGSGITSPTMGLPSSGQASGQEAREASQEQPQHFATGGTVANTRSHPKDSEGTDTEQAMLAPGEEVIPAQQAEANRPLLKAIESGQDMAPAVGLTSPAMGLQSSGQASGQEASKVSPAQHSGQDMAPGSGITSPTMGLQSSREASQEQPQHFATGGTVANTGANPANAQGSDTEPALLQPGEEVIPAHQANANRALLKDIESGEAVAPGGGLTNKSTSPEAATSQSPSLEDSGQELHLAGGGTVALLAHRQSGQGRMKADVRNLELTSHYKGQATKYINQRINNVEQDEPPPLDDSQRRTMQGIFFERWLHRQGLGEHNPGEGLDFPGANLEVLAKLTGTPLEELKDIKGVEAKRTSTSKNLAATARKAKHHGYAEGGEVQEEAPGSGLTSPATALPSSGQETGQPQQQALEGQDWNHQDAMDVFVKAINSDMADDGHELKQGDDGNLSWQHMSEGGQVEAGKKQGWASSMLGKVAATYAKLAKRYGPNWAKAVMGAGALGIPIPIPLASIATAAPVLAAAELHRYFTGGKQATPMESGGEVADKPQDFASQGSDTQPAVLTPGEEVIPAQQAEKNRPLLKEIEQGALHMATGGTVPGATAPAAADKPLDLSALASLLLPALEKIVKAVEGIGGKLGTGNTSNGGSSLASGTKALAGGGGMGEKTPAVRDLDSLKDAFKPLFDVMDQVGKLGDETKPLYDGLSKLATEFPHDVDAISKAFHELESAEKEYKDSLKAVEEARGKASPQQQARLAVAQANLGKAKKQASEPLKEKRQRYVREIVGSTLGRHAAGVVGGIQQAAGGIGKMADGDMLGGLAGAMGGIAGAAGAVVDAFKELIAKTRAFVEAFNPVIVQEFDRAFRDLQATIGSAFAPIFEILTGTMREVAGIIMPAMEALKPVIEHLTQVFADVLIPVVELVVGIFDALLPVIEAAAAIIELLVNLMKPLIFIVQILAIALKVLLAPFTLLAEILKPLNAIMDGFSQMLRILSIAFKAVVDAVISILASIMGIDTADMMEALHEVIQRLVQAFVLLIGYIMFAFGAMNALKNFIEGLTPKQGRTAAIQGVQTKGFEQIAKDITVASFSAVGAGSKAKDKVDLSDVIKTLEDLQKGEAGAIAEIQKTLGLIKDGVDVIKIAVKIPGAVFEGAKIVAASPFGDLGKAIFGVGR